MPQSMEPKDEKRLYQGRVDQDSDAFVLHVEDDGEGFDLDKVRRRSSGLGW